MDISIGSRPAEVGSGAQTFGVVGLTCGHCASAVTAEVSALPGVAAVVVQLVAGGVSTVRVEADHVVSDGELSGALEEAGDYRLVGT
jgi:copper chaperone